MTATIWDQGGSQLGVQSFTLLGNGHMLFNVASQWTVTDAGHHRIASERRRWADRPRITIQSLRNVRVRAEGSESIREHRDRCSVLNVEQGHARQWCGALGLELHTEFLKWEGSCLPFGSRHGLSEGLPYQTLKGMPRARALSLTAFNRRSGNRMFSRASCFSNSKRTRLRRRGRMP